MSSLLRNFVTLTLLELATTDVLNDKTVFVLAETDSASFEQLQSQMNELERLQAEQRKAEKVTKEALEQENRMLKMRNAGRNGHLTWPQTLQRYGFGLMNGAFFGSMASGWLLQQGFPRSIAGLATVVSMIGTLFFCFLARRRKVTSRRLKKKRKSYPLDQEKSSTSEYLSSRQMPLRRKAQHSRPANQPHAADIIYQRDSASSTTVVIIGDCN